MISRTASSCIPAIANNFFRHQNVLRSSVSHNFSSCVQSNKEQIVQSSDSIGDLNLHYNNIMESSTISKTNANTQSSSSSSPTAVITDIEDIHRQAILDKQSTYIDPSTGFTVFTELSHLKRGKCCGNQCRHCPYGWSNVKNERGEFVTDSSARVVSGDRERTGLLVKRILNGTYYDIEDDTYCNVTNIPHDTDNVAEENSKQMNTNINQSKTPKHIKGEGKGGSAGGTLTSKNVPYTRKGDTGTSQLFTGERRKKDDVLFEALGTVDELCSVVGVVYAELNSSIEKQKASDNNSDDSNRLYGDLPDQLLDVMSRLFDVGSHIATPQKTTNNQQQEQATNVKSRNNSFHNHHAAVLEEWIDTMTDELPELTSFILPTGSIASAQLHVVRTVCRRAERRMVPMVQEEQTVDPAALSYVNRLSDYFFTAARFVNYCEDRDEVQYRREVRLDGDDEGDKGRRRDETNLLQRERVVVKLKK